VKKWVARFELSTDGGVIVLALLAVATVALVGIRLATHTVATQNVIEKDKFFAKFNSTDFTGIARVVDGDTIELSGKKIRIFGIDAPERGQVCRDETNQNYGCGIRASAMVDALIAGQEVTCVPRSRDKYDRSVAVCSVRGQDIAREIVAAGWAVAFERYSSDYVALEEHAREKRLGLWQGEFELPSSVRSQKVSPH
jgi:endonuclease YncB( thermonuclease family)